MSGQPGANHWAHISRNREQAAEWLDSWQFPHMRWEPLPEFPSPYLGFSRDQFDAFEHIFSASGEYYQWIVTGQPQIGEIAEAHGAWEFNAQHAFQRLQVQVVVIPDPDFIAAVYVDCMRASRIDTLADLAEDRTGAQHYRDWFARMVVTACDSGGASGTGRRDRTKIGFQCMATALHPGMVATVLELTPTQHTLDGSPLPEYAPEAPS
ncbi:hypothetical protein [Nocardia cyriacigeorgica]|uniref:Uncharacterized protein n=1 Tax=Nocardia cyriacigeorgica (strain GUH-2) TaxID=1127134 RepID=H6QYA6_NOCCG|nr:hypothetical protein [Nocardia cyriacigeorgica]CCF62752.1 protein of unknown function [Nocardia cyriacigeorgica GUH-2]